jgi:predicted nucleic acid-binding protein
MKPQNQTAQINKALVFDSGALISFSMNGITRIIKELKGIFNGKFLITSEVKREVIDVPMKIKKFELEALKIKRLLDEGTLEMPSSIGIKDSEIEDLDNKFLTLANSTFNGRGKDIHILDHGEASCLALSRILTEKGIDNLIAMDERTTRLLVEKPENLKNIFEDRMNTKISINSENAGHFQGFKIIRSTELAYIAYKKGLVDLKDGDTVLDALLYALKFKGAAISGEEIEEIKKLA